MSDSKSSKVKFLIGKTGSSESLNSMNESTELTPKQININDSVDNIQNAASCSTPHIDKASTPPDAKINKPHLVR
jgi:hypothetical protein